jgi:hypothetical protein
MASLGHYKRHRPTIYFDGIAARPLLETILMTNFQALELFWLFGIVSGGLSMIAFFPYIIDTIQGRSLPQRASWLIWSVLGSVALASQISEGATDSLWFAGIQVGGTVLIFALSLWRGTGVLMRRSDYKVLFAAAVGIGLWYLTDTPAYALIISIGVSLLGGAVTVAKAYANPSSETMSFWIWSGVSAVFAILSVGAWDPMMIAYPAYILVLNVAIVTAIVVGRSQGRSITLSDLRAVGASLDYDRRQQMTR